MIVAVVLTAASRRRASSELLQLKDVRALRTSRRAVASQDACRRCLCLGLTEMAPSAAHQRVRRRMAGTAQIARRLDAVRQAVAGWAASESVQRARGLQKARGGRAGAGTALTVNPAPGSCAPSPRCGAANDQHSEEAVRRRESLERAEGLRGRWASATSRPQTALSQCDAQSTPAFLHAATRLSFVWPCPRPEKNQKSHHGGWWSGAKCITAPRSRRLRRSRGLCVFIDQPRRHLNSTMASHSSPPAPRPSTSTAPHLHRRRSIQHDQLQRPMAGSSGLPSTRNKSTRGRSRSVQASMLTEAEFRRLPESIQYVRALLFRSFCL